MSQEPKTETEQELEAEFDALPLEQQLLLVTRILGNPELKTPARLTNRQLAQCVSASERALKYQKAKALSKMRVAAEAAGGAEEHISH